MALHRSRPGPDYTLRWPRPLFVREAHALANGPDSPSLSEEVELLLEEAFVSDQPKRDFEQTRRPLPALDVTGTTSRLAAAALGRSRRQQHLDELIAAAPQMPEQAAPRPYYSSTAPSLAGYRVSTARVADAKRAWRITLGDLLERGYLDRAAPRPCVDEPRDEYDPGQGDLLNSAFVQRLGEPGPWNRVPEAWPDAHFFGMVEVGHDLVARPRRRWFHDFSGCGWHFSDFAVDPAQILYRWTVNRLLTEHGIGLQLAKSGEDVGRLVRVASDGREELVSTATSRLGTQGDVVRHAVALFRDRDATIEHKRSACIALAGVLETRRELIKIELLSNDEGALFEIANRFAIRHQKADQRRDYDEAYLDWLYWWYLGTIELTDRLSARDGAR